MLPAARPDGACSDDVLIAEGATATAKTPLRGGAKGLVVDLPAALGEEARCGGL